MTTKPWYRSRTLWINAAWILAAVLGERTPWYFDPLWCMVGIAASNLWLRAVTRDGVVWRP